MTWNYRVVKKDGFLGIHGVYYDESEKIIGTDQDPNTPLGKIWKILRTRLKLMLECLNKDVIDYDSISEKAE